MKLYKKILVLLICMLPLVVSVNAQGSADKAIKKTEKLKAQKDAEALKKYQKAVKRHNKDQTKDTRKRMRQSRQKAREANPNHKDFFLKRWFLHMKKKK